MFVLNAENGRPLLRQPRMCNTRFADMGRHADERKAGEALRLRGGARSATRTWNNLI